MTAFQYIVATILVVACGAGYFLGMRAKEALEIFGFTLGVILLYVTVILGMGLLGIQGVASVRDYLLLTGFQIGAMPLFLSYLLAAFAAGGLLSRRER